MTISLLTLCLFILLWSNPSFSSRLSTPKIFDVIRYGAVADGKTDNVEAFLKAWKDACAWDGKARVYIPSGTYLLGQVTFSGGCKGSMAFLIKGTLVAPTNQNQFYNQSTWITFRYVNGLLVSGGGTLDGQGVAAWRYNDCATNQKCLSLPATMTFDFIRNGKIKSITSKNSKNTHFSIFACMNMNFSQIRITAPGNSPNTDGIKIGMSSQITISHSVIGTGDDCISILSDSSGIDIDNVVCGPGHGISIGSLGRNNNNVYETVNQIHVKNCTLQGTTSGVRIKTKTPSNTGIASNITYENIFMDDVKDPIIIDQQYCPHGSCSTQTASNIQIEDVTYKNIWGTSRSKVAVTFNCSKTLPCKNIVTKDINLSLVRAKGGQQSSSICTFANGGSYGHQNPPSCL